MKNISLFTLILIALSFNSYSQEIKDIQAYSKFGTTRIIALTSDNNAHLYTPDDGWEALPKNELPEGDINFLDVYHQLSGSKLMAVMEDQSIWRFQDDKWDKMPIEGLKGDYTIKAFKPYTEFKMMGTSSARAIIVLENNSIWHFTKSENWEPLHKKGLPASAEISNITSFQKPKGMGYRTGLIIQLADNSIYHRTVKDKKWEKYEMKELPEGSKVIAIDSYLKSSVMGGPEGRIILALKNGGIWWTEEDDEYWESIEMKGLPEDYKIKRLKVFQKGLSARILVLLEDNSIWWYSTDTGFSQVDNSAILE